MLEMKLSSIVLFTMKSRTSHQNSFWLIRQSSSGLWNIARWYAAFCWSVFSLDQISFDEISPFFDQDDSLYPIKEAMGWLALVVVSRMLHADNWGGRDMNNFLPAFWVLGSSSFQSEPSYFVLFVLKTMLPTFSHMGTLVHKRWVNCQYV